MSRYTEGFTRGELEKRMKVCGIPFSPYCLQDQSEGIHMLNDRTHCRSLRISTGTPTIERMLWDDTGSTLRFQRCIRPAVDYDRLKCHTRAGGHMYTVSFMTATYIIGCGFCFCASIVPFYALSGP